MYDRTYIPILYINASCSYVQQLLCLMLNPELETKGIESEEPGSAPGKILVKMQAIHKGREKYT